MGVQLGCSQANVSITSVALSLSPLPILEAVFERGFTKASDLPPTWKMLFFPIMLEAELRQVLDEDSGGKY